MKTGSGIYRLAYSYDHRPIYRHHNLCCHKDNCNPLHVCLISYLDPKGFCLPVGVAVVWDLKNLCYMRQE